MVERVWHSNRIVAPTETCSVSKNLKPYSINCAYLMKNRRKSITLNRLANPLTGPKIYRSILKTFLNNKKKNPSIPPLFQGNKFIADFKEKAELFIHFFVNQCFFLSNNSVLPTDLPQFTIRCLHSIHFLSN